MRFSRKLTLNNYLSHASMLILVASFILAFLFAFAPTMPDLPQDPAQLRWFVSSWNLAGPLMFIVVFRIHALRRIFKTLMSKPTIGVTPWVRFWFLAAMFFGLATTPYLAHSFLQNGSTFSSSTYLLS
ncbi:hypothetical protein AKJ35_00165 [candidate division MSBL1 archaeon SCGC-AAA833F18]|uniref:Uncharacterized protein n=1 Tax=candidate division MSBL1 archaeon SCGC-AAA833F18 TaxID=1698257 RepID=A0A133VT85_9EURY|nr:hypothetical protein AKJ35_00165 [candidate division MSBL1 archaeon SCGC-AAA833F18]